MNKIIQGMTYRFTVITDHLLRIEEDKTGKFEDRPTQTVLNRDFGSPEVEVIHDSNGHELEIITKGFHLYYDGGEFSSESLYIDINRAYATYQNRWYFGADNDDHNRNLKGTIRTLDKIDGETELPKGLMSTDGYSYLDDSNSFIYLESTDTFVARETPVVDGYLFCYGRDYQTTLSDFYKLSGPTPMLPRYALGNWWSRFYPYTQTSYVALMQRFDYNKIPINVSVIDMDWHQFNIPKKYGSGWTGYSWNKELFPNHQKMLTWLHKDAKKVTLNVHPAAGIRAFEDNYPDAAKTMGIDPKSEEPLSFDLENKKFRQAYFSDIHHRLEAEGIDFWWIDWQQGLARSQKRMDPLWLLNYYHYQDNNQRTNGDGLILSRYAGPGSHRYPLGFSGDTVISWASLNFQPYFTITAANIGYTWWSHDIGGHMHGNFDGELATRWLQFGVFSPINRLHSSNNIFAGKEPWNYRVDFEQSQIQFLQLRDKLLPYLDTANYQTHEYGIPVVKPLYYDYPNEDNAYQVKNEYIFGSQMIVSPITRPHDDQTQMAFSTTWLPEGDWVDYQTYLPYKGNCLLQTYRDIDQMPIFVRQGSLIVTNPDFMEDINQLPTQLEVEVFPGADGQFELVEHQGNQFAKTEFHWDDKNAQLTWVTDDSSKIIPKDRQITTLICQSTLEDVTQELIQRIQRFNIKFDLKQQLYDAFVSPDYRYDGYINLLNTLDNNDVRNSLAEVAYMRQSL